MSNIKTAIVCMAANENLYIRDFVKWHLAIGFTKIFIVDNSPINGEHPDLILADYISYGRVQIIKLCKTKICNPPLFQMIVFTELYEELHHDFDWMFFIDVDEFVSFKSNTETFNIVEFLERDCFKNAEQIRWNWMCYGDNDKLYYDNQPVWKRFPKPMQDFNKHDWAGAYPVNGSLKTAIRCTTEGVDFITLKSPHYPLTPTMQNAIVVSPSGKPRNWNKSVGKIDFESGWLAHYRTLTITEFLNRRLSAQALEQANGNVYSKESLLALFCVENVMTPAKQKIWDEYIERVEKEHPDIFSSDKRKQLTTNITSQEITILRNDIRDVVIGKKKWEH